MTVDGFSYDIARARRETYAHPGALPAVTPAPLAEDLLRRDFTVNALAIALGDPVPGSLAPAPRGLEDLEAQQLRVLQLLGTGKLNKEIAHELGVGKGTATVSVREPGLRNSKQEPIASAGPSTSVTVQ